jgi:hypothetical protein
VAEPFERPIQTNDSYTMVQRMSYPQGTSCGVDLATPDTEAAEADDAGSPGRPLRGHPQE